MTITSTDYYEVPGSPKEQGDMRARTMSATRSFKVGWEKRYEFILYMFTYANRLYVHNTYMMANSWSIAPFDEKVEEAAGQKYSEYDYASIDIEYEAVIGEPKDGSVSSGNVTGTDFCEEQVDIETQILQTTSGVLYWNQYPPRKAIDEGQAPDKLFSIKTYSVTFHNCLYIPDSFDELSGTVNNQQYEFKALEKTIIPEKLRYDGYSKSRSITTFGTAGWDITLTFAQILNGVDKTWNHFWNPDKQEWSRIYDKTTPVNMYEPADWAPIGIPDTPSS
jgi:hypothetical protein